MKTRILCLLLALVMTVGMLGVLASCGEETTDNGGNNNTGSTCPPHRDSNKDKVCDKCGQPMPGASTDDGGNEGGNGDGPSDGPVCNHVDENEDGECDICFLEIKDTHDCVDEDGDNLCDICGVSTKTEIISYPWDSQTLIFQFTDNDNNQELSSGCKRYLAGGDSNYNEEIDKSVKKRNAAAENLTKVKVTYDYWPNTEDYGWGSCIDKIEKIVNSQSTGQVPDVYCNFVYDMVGASVKGCFANLRGTSRGSGELKGLNYFEFLDDDYDESVDNRGYMDEYMRSVTLSMHKMYILASDYFTDMIRAFFIIPVGTKLLETYGEDITGDWNDDERFTLDDFYEQVFAGEWDYDLMMDYSAAVYQDDGNANTSGEWLGDNRVGFAMASGGVAASGLLYTTSVVIIEKQWDKNANDYSYFYEKENEPLYDFCEATTELFRAPGIFIARQNSGQPTSLDQWGKSSLLAIRTRFSEGAVLFGDIMMVGALEFEEYQSMGEIGGFGVVPVPLYSGRDSGDRYLTQIHNVGRPGAIGVNTKKFVECTAFLNYVSTHSTDILNDYYNYKLCYDIAGGAQGTVEMLKYIRLNVRTSFDKVFEDAIGVFHGEEAYDDKILVIISGDGFECETIRAQYASLYDKKTKYLEVLVKYYETAGD